MTAPQVLVELLLEIGSWVVVEIVAVLHRSLPLVAPALRCRASVNDAEAAGCSVPLVHVNPTGPGVPAAGFAHVQPAGAASDWKVVPAGMVSATETAVATLGPSLLATIE